MSDPGKYRTREEIQETRENRDPIERVRALLLYKKYISEEEIKKIDANIKEEVSEAAEEARLIDLPDETELFEDVFEDKIWGDYWQRRSIERMPLLKKCWKELKCILVGEIWR